MTKAQINRREVLLRKLFRNLKKNYPEKYDSWLGYIKVDDQYCYTDGHRMYLLNDTYVYNENECCKIKMNINNVYKIFDSITTHTTKVDIVDLKRFIKERNNKTEPYILTFNKLDKQIKINPIYLLEALQMFNTNEVSYDKTKWYQIYIYGENNEKGTIYIMK